MMFVLFKGMIAALRARAYMSAGLQGAVPVPAGMSFS